MSERSWLTRPPDPQAIRGKCPSTAEGRLGRSSRGGHLRCPSTRLTPGWRECLRPSPRRKPVPVAGGLIMAFDLLKGRRSRSRRIALLSTALIALASTVFVASGPSANSASCLPKTTTIGGKHAVVFCGPAKVTARAAGKTFSFKSGSCVRQGASTFFLQMGTIGGPTAKSGLQQTPLFYLLTDPRRARRPRQFSTGSSTGNGTALPRVAASRLRQAERAGASAGPSHEARSTPATGRSPALSPARDRRRLPASNHATTAAAGLRSNSAAAVIAAL